MPWLFYCPLCIENIQLSKTSLFERPSDAHLGQVEFILYQYLEAGSYKLSSYSGLKMDRLLTYPKIHLKCQFFGDKKFRIQAGDGDLTL